jgi:hypothetical protein
MEVVVVEVMIRKEVVSFVSVGQAVGGSSQKVYELFFLPSLGGQH